VELKQNNNCANWRKTDSQSCRRRAVLSFEKGNLVKAANYCKYLAYTTNDAEIKRKAKLDGLYFRERAKRKQRK
jgi:hypothetical protein